MSGARRAASCAFALAFAALAAACSSNATGRFEASGPRLGRWTMAPDRCLSGLRRGYVGADLFRADEREDTELVVVQRLEGPMVLARIPGTDEMVVFHVEECATLEVDVHGNGVKVNGVPAVSGTVSIACDKPGFGSVRGVATFTCY